MRLQDSSGPEDYMLLEHLSKRSVEDSCNSTLAVDKLLEWMRHVNDEAPGGPPGSFALVHEQMARRTGQMLSLRYGSLFLRKLFYHHPQYDWMFQPLVKDLAEHPQLCQVCCDSDKRMLVLTLLDHKSSGGEFSTSALQESIVAWKNLEKLITSQDGLWIMRRVIEQRKDLHGTVAEWLVSFPSKYLSSMSADIVTLMLWCSPEEDGVQALANAYLERSGSEWAKLIFDPKNRFALLIEALYCFSREHARLIDAVHASHFWAAGWHSCVRDMESLAERSTEATERASSSDEEAA
jgi:hypothetical protein